MNSPDPGSLQNLNDIVLPATISWWPLATGWYVFTGVFLVAIIWFGYHSIQRWINNRYRRTALAKLQQLSNGFQDVHKRSSSLRQLPRLLKRCALSAYPREQVAALSGDGWYGFLNSQVKEPCFTEPMTGLLDNISYSTSDLNYVDIQTATALSDAIKHWLKHHRTSIRPEGGKET